MAAPLSFSRKVDKHNDSITERDTSRKEMQKNRWYSAASARSPEAYGAGSTASPIREGIDSKDKQISAELQPS